MFFFFITAEVSGFALSHWLWYMLRFFGKYSKPPRFELCSSTAATAALYATLAWRLRKLRPAGRLVVLVPGVWRAQQIHRVLQAHVTLSIWKPVAGL